MTVLPQKATLAIVPSAGWNTILDKIQNGTDLDVLLGRIARDVRIAVPTSGSGTPGDPFPGADIQAAVPAAGGRLLIPPGSWDVSTRIASIPASTTLLGAGPSTILNGPASSQAILLDQDFCQVRSLQVNMHATAGGGILVRGTGAPSATIRKLLLSDLYFRGGAATTWAIRMDNGIEYAVEDIYCGVPDIFNANGILLDNTGGNINYGDASIRNVTVFLNADNTTGVRIHGEEAGGGNIIGTTAWTQLIVSTLQGAPTGMIGLEIVNSEYHTFHHPHFEGVNTAIDIRGQVGGGAFARFNTFLGGLISSDITMDAGTRANMFVGGAYNGIITDLNTSTGLPNTFYGHSPVGLLRMETGRVDLKNRSGQQCITARLNNRTGGTSVVGRLVKQASSDNDGYEELTGTDDDNWIGLVHEAVGNAQPGRVVIYGIANADFSGAVTRGDFVIHDTANPGQVVSNGTTLPATGLLVGIATQTLGSAGQGRVLLGRA